MYVSNFIKLENIQRKATMMITTISHLNFCERLNFYMFAMYVEDTEETWLHYLTFNNMYDLNSSDLFDYPFNYKLQH